MLFLFYNYTVCTVLNPKWKTLNINDGKKSRLLISRVVIHHPVVGCMAWNRMAQKPFCSMYRFDMFFPVVQNMQWGIGDSKDASLCQDGKIIVKNILWRWWKNALPRKITVEMSSEDYYQKMPYYQRPSLEDSKLHKQIVYRYILWTRHLETLE